ncbi:hypothetical protein [Methanococcoides sp. NM1]|uniref:hypothetical protein n=1 Tax=Methanococcoides sp. NM1 TaxID=1201013 RepID=UPI00108267E5|nr:hypothetical protein [Methanococcoides sp. NM1]
MTITNDSETFQDEIRSVQKGLARNEIIARTSKSVCPEYLKVINCQMILRENKVFLRKHCVDHGSFETPVYSDANDYLDVLSTRACSSPLHYQKPVSKSCRLDYGLCADYQQHTCVGIVEITDTCNLNCPIGFVDSRGSFIPTF